MESKTEECPRSSLFMAGDFIEYLPKTHSPFHTFNNNNASSTISTITKDNDTNVFVTLANRDCFCVGSDECGGFSSKSIVQQGSITPINTTWSWAVTSSKEKKRVHKMEKKAALVAHGRVVAHLKKATMSTGLDGLIKDHPIAESTFAKHKLSNARRDAEPDVMDSVLATRPTPWLPFRYDRGVIFDLK